MAASLVPIQIISEPNYHHNISARRRGSIVRCCRREYEEKQSLKKNHYELLGVSVFSKPQEIKNAYRQLQKMYHPDIAGQKGHEHTLMLNEAYKVLMREDARRDYDATIGAARIGFGNDESGLGYSSWNGPLRLEALFVDENACIGCRECINYAPKTFTWDETQGCARVKVQYGDEDQDIEVSVDSCPVNCIHRVDREDLAVLEYLIQPKKREGYGIFGQGWERPANVFMEANTFKKRLKNQASSAQRTEEDMEQESRAQAEARINASIKLKMDKFTSMWNWVKHISGN